MSPQGQRRSAMIINGTVVFRPNPSRDEIDAATLEDRA
jgi:hypothetical protein